MSVESRAFHVLPPRAGQQWLVATSAVVGTPLDLRTLGPQTATTDSAVLRGSPGALRKYITVSAITSDCYVAFASTSAAVASLTISTTGVNQANTAFPIFAGTSKDFILEDNDIFLGFIATAAGFIHVYISSNQ